MSGTIMERRDHVLMTFLVPFSFCVSTFLIRWSSTNGPFLRLRGIGQLLPLLLATTSDDEPVGGLVGLPGATLWLAPRAGGVATTGGLALTATVRVVDRVHRDAADGRALALPPHAAGLAPVDVGLLGVADLADRGAAAQVDHPHLTRGHPQRGVLALLGQQLGAGAGRTGQLGAAAGPQLDRVHDRTGRHVAQRQAVARLDVGGRTVLDAVALLHTGRAEDVALLPVGVVQQRDPRGAVRVVLDVRDLRRHAVFVGAPEVDHSVRTLVAAALVPRGDVAVYVPATLLGKRTHQRLLRLGTSDLDEVGHTRAAATGGRRLVLTDAHLFRSSLVCLRKICRSGPALRGARRPEVARLRPLTGGVRHGGEGHETGPPKMSIRSPSARLTMARLV